jgi:hypothetical protein
MGAVDCVPILEISYPDGVRRDGSGLGVYGRRLP